jgi:hypothetical protein
MKVDEVVELLAKHGKGEFYLRGGSCARTIAYPDRCPLAFLYRKINDGVCDNY